MIQGSCWPLKSSCVVNWRVIVVAVAVAMAQFDQCAEAVAVLVRTPPQEQSVVIRGRDKDEELSEYSTQSRTDNSIHPKFYCYSTYSILLYYLYYCLLRHRNPGCPLPKTA